MGNCRADPKPMNAFARLLAVALLGLAGGDLRAEDAGRSCRILFLNPPKDAPKSLQLFDGTSCQEVHLPGMNLSPAYRIAAGTKTLHLLADTLEDAAALPPGAPSVDLPAGGGDFYLILTSDPQNAIVPVAARALHPVPDLRKGQLFWINLTEMTIEGTLGEEELKLEPSGTQILDAPTKKRGAYPVALAYPTPGDDTPARSMSQTQWLHDPESRQLVVVFLNEETDAPRAIAFPDFRPED